MFGLLNIAKPAGVTSRDVVNHVQRLVRPAKVGHAGTLDPLATGVLVVCIGPATRLVPLIQEQRKVYRATFLLGRTSDTDDVEGTVTELPGARPIPREELVAILPEFIGRIEQTPPQFSAVKVQGRRAYDLARRGESVNLTPRIVEVHRIELVRFAYPEFTLEIECGSGTYVRSIGRDLGGRLGTAAVMSALERTRIGPFRINEAVPMERVTAERLPDHVLPAATAVTDLPRHLAMLDEIRHLQHGRPIRMTGGPSWTDGVQIAVLDGGAELIALAECRGNQLFPRQVLTPPPDRTV